MGSNVVQKSFAKRDGAFRAFWIVGMDGPRRHHDVPE
jgi:hypothetical protein